MISIKIERAVFILIFIALYVVMAFVITPIKVEQAPVNIDLTPDEVIRKELPVYDNDKLLDYNYEIINDTLFVWVETGKGREQHIGYRNNNSGFMFELPQSIFCRKNDYYSLRTISNKAMVSVQISKKVKDYVVRIIVVDLSPNDKTDFNVIDHLGNPLRKIEGFGDTWIDVFESLPERYEITVQIDDKNEMVINRQDIMSHFGWRQ